jgi:hypothetical protein
MRKLLPQTPCPILNEMPTRCPIGHRETRSSWQESSRPRGLLRDCPPAAGCYHLSDESCLGATVPAAETVVPMCKIESKAMSPAHRAKLGAYLMVGLEEDERNGRGTSTSRDQRNTAHGGDGTPDQQSLDGFGSFVGMHCLNVGQVTHHMVLEQNAVAAQ